MFKFFDKLKKSKAGYTLTELIVVVAILGILAAVTIPMVIGQVAKANKSTDDSNAIAISNAYKIYVAENGVCDTAGKAVTAIEATLSPIPTPKTSHSEFMINLSTGNVIYADIDTTVPGYVDLQ